MKKFTEAEFVVFGMLALIVDGICIILDFLVIGLALSPLIQGVASFGTSCLLKSKGDSGAFGMGRQFSKQLSNLLPVLPTVFAAFMIEAYIHNHPKKFGALAVVEKIGKIAK